MKGAKVFLVWNRGSQKVTIAFKCKNYYEEEADRLFSISTRVSTCKYYSKITWFDTRTAC